MLVIVLLDEGDLYFVTNQQKTRNLILWFVDIICRIT